MSDHNQPCTEIQQLNVLEAAVGVEPTNSSFANCCLGPLGDAADFRAQQGSSTKHCIKICQSL